MPRTAKFIERYGLYTPDQIESAERSRKLVEQHGIDVVRLVWPDQYGLLRGKALTRAAYFGALEAGNEITMAPFFLDSANAIVLNPFAPDGGFEIDARTRRPTSTASPTGSTASTSSCSDPQPVRCSPATTSRLATPARGTPRSGAATRGTPPRMLRR